MKVGTRKAEVGSRKNEASGLILANKSFVSDRRFDCLPEFDHRSRMFLSRSKVPVDAPIKDKLYACRQWLDQGQEGACVGFGFSHELVAEPVAVPHIDDDYARRLYKLIQTKDEWPGENYEGTSVLAGAKTLKDLGYLTEYYWATSAQEVGQALSHLGPVVIGVTWRAGMERTNAKGLIRPTGAIRGGHCVMLRGVKRTACSDGSTFVVRGRNSWGRQWGQDGDFFLTERDLQTLVDDGGTFCVPDVRADSGKQPPKIRTAKPWWARLWGKV